MIRAWRPESRWLPFEGSRGLLARWATGARAKARRLLERWVAGAWARSWRLLPARGDKPAHVGMASSGLARAAAAHAALVATIAIVGIGSGPHEVWRPASSSRSTAAPSEGGGRRRRSNSLHISVVPPSVGGAAPMRICCVPLFYSFFFDVHEVNNGAVCLPPSHEPLPAAGLRPWWGFMPPRLARLVPAAKIRVGRAQICVAHFRLLFFSCLIFVQASPDHGLRTSAAGHDGLGSRSPPPSWWVGLGLG